MVASALRWRSRVLDSPWPVWGLAIWLPIAAALATTALVVYAAVQQDIRQSANEPQVTLAESTAERLNEGDPPELLVASRPVDLRDSLAPFVVVYDSDGHVLASSASLDGLTPTLPPGVLATVDRCATGVSLWSAFTQVATARLHGKRPCPMPGMVARPGETRFTWQPAPGVRAAAVLTGYRGPASGYVLAGRSLRETEMLEDHILALVGFGLLAALGVTLIAALGSAAVVTALRR
jgi:hypothetical protein